MKNKNLEKNISFLRQWLNENRNCTPMVTNGDIKFWLELGESFKITDDKMVCNVCKKPFTQVDAHSWQCDTPNCIIHKKGLILSVG